MSGLQPFAAERKRFSAGPLEQREFLGPRLASDASQRLPDENRARVVLGRADAGRERRQQAGRPRPRHVLARRPNGIRHEHGTREHGARHDERGDQDHQSPIINHHIRNHQFQYLSTV